MMFGSMNKVVLIGVGLAGLLLIGAIIALGTWDVPPPTGTVETRIDDSRFPR